MDALDILKARLAVADGPPIDDTVLQSYLDTATSIILSRRYPTQDWPVDEHGDFLFPVRYEDLRVRIALELVARIGTEGEVIHYENGVSRTYDSSGVSRRLLAEVVPLVSVPRASV